MISIIVPVYNTDVYLDRCIYSINFQSEKSIEKILIDDGSIDSSGMISDEQCYLFINTIVIHQKNQGQASARNKAIKLSHGEMISFVDSDDLIHPKMLEYLHKAMDDTQSDIGAVDFVQDIDIPMHFFCDIKNEYEAIRINEDTIYELYKDGRYYWMACAKLYKRELFNHYLFIEGRVYEDNEAIPHWLCNSKSMVLVPEKMYFYQKNLKSTTNRIAERNIYDFLWALEKQTVFYKQMRFRRMTMEIYNEYFLYYRIFRIDAKEGQINGVSLKILDSNALSFWLKIGIDIRKSFSYLCEILINIIKYYFKRANNAEKDTYAR